MRGTCDPPRGPNSFNFMQFSGKFGKIVCWPTRGVGAPFSEKSWIRNRYICNNILIQNDTKYTTPYFKMAFKVVCASDSLTGGLQFKSGILHLLKHACAQSDWLLCWSYITYTSNMNQAAHSGIKTHRRRCQKSKTGVSVVPKMDITNFF